jgi:hypothetical protein
MTFPVFFPSLKNPGDVDDWIVDFSNTLVSASGTYDTITGTPTVVSSSSNLTVTNIAVLAGTGGTATAVGFWLTGGVAGFSYQITITIKTANGRTFTRVVNVSVANIYA